MALFELKKDIYSIGAADPELRTFDIIMRTEFGTTYNAYLIKGSEKNALVETVKSGFFDEYLENIQKLTPVSQIDYIIMNHTEPDHAGSVGKLLELNPDITVVGSAGAINFLKKIVNRGFKNLAVKENDVLSLGNKTLRFMMLPNLHWPDTMFTYCEEDKTLFTCDCFGSHYGTEQALRSKIKNETDYLGAVKYYFDCIISPFKRPFLANALQRIKPLDIELVCTGHGPVLDRGVDQIIKLYTEWCAENKPAKKTVVIAYVSAYGYTKMLADAIAEGAAEDGETDVKIYNISDLDPGMIIDEMAKSDGFMIGTPTMLGDATPPAYMLTTHMYKAVFTGKTAAAFGSYGWSGEAVANLSERFKQLKLNVVEGFRARFMPDRTELEQAKQFGKAFAAQISRK